MDGLTDKMECQLGVTYSKHMKSQGWTNGEAEIEGQYRVVCANDWRNMFSLQQRTPLFQNLPSDFKEKHPTFQRRDSAMGTK